MKFCHQLNVSVTRLNKKSNHLAWITYKPLFLWLSTIIFCYLKNLYSLLRSLYFFPPLRYCSLNHSLLVSFAHFITSSTSYLITLCLILMRSEERRVGKEC